MGVDAPMSLDLPKLFRLAAWACLVLLAVLSWLPAEEMIRTGINGQIEHVMAYLGTMLLVGAAYGLRLGLFRLAAMLVAYAGVLELGQSFSPGRHSSAFDFAASSCGVIAGAVVFQLAYAVFRDTPIGREMRRANQPPR
jgi:VanZ family protein